MPQPNRIDVHCHIVPKPYNDACRDVGAIPARGSFPDWSPDLHLKLMDDNNIEVAVTSVVPGVQFFEPRRARAIARETNEISAENVSRRPDRFGAFAMVPMHDAEHAADEIEFALGTLKLDGVCLLTSYDGEYLGSPKFDPVLEALNKYKATVFIHPYHAGPHLPGAPAKTIHLSYPSFIMEYPFDTTRMAAHLLFSGAFDKYSDINFILPHAGGTLPFMAWRLNIAQTFGDFTRDWTFEELRSRLKRFWYDTAMSGGHEMLNCLKDLVGADRIVYGSDWPMANEVAVGRAIDSIDVPGFFSEDERIAIERGNVLQLFPRFQK